MLSMRSGRQEGLNKYVEAEFNGIKNLANDAKCFAELAYFRSRLMTRQKEMVCPGMNCFLKAGTLCTMPSVSILSWREQVEGVLAGPGPRSFTYPQ